MRFDLVINTLTIKALKENKFSIFGGNQYRAICHVSDVVDVYIQCLEAPLSKVGKQIFNVATDNIKIIQIGEAVRKMIKGSKMEVDIDLKDSRNYCVDGSKIEKVLHFKGTKDIIEAIEEIKNAVVKKNLYSDYKDPKYSNVEHLRDKI
jgi:nucleoside-diphosphate-sugar epimerase